MRREHSLITETPVLPDGYTELQYIEGTGTQYIDTGLSAPIYINNMETTIQQNNRIFNLIMAIVAAFLLLFAAMAWHNAGYRKSVTESATMQWTSDTSWTEGW